MCALQVAVGCCMPNACCARCLRSWALPSATAPRLCSPWPSSASGDKALPCLPLPTPARHRHSTRSSHNCYSSHASAKILHTSVNVRWAHECREREAQLNAESAERAQVEAQLQELRGQLSRVWQEREELRESMQEQVCVYVCVSACICRGWMGELLEWGCIVLLRKMTLYLRTCLRHHDGSDLPADCICTSLFTSFTAPDFAPNAHITSPQLPAQLVQRDAELARQVAEKDASLHSLNRVIARAAEAASEEAAAHQHALQRLQGDLEAMVGAARQRARVATHVFCCVCFV